MNLTKIINDHIEYSYTNESRNYIGASSIGHQCLRHIWYGFNGVEQSPPTHKTITAFNVGKRLESLPIELLQQAGIQVVRPNPDNDYLLFKDKDVKELQGHADGLICVPFESPAIIEIKTAKNSSFNNFKNKGLKIWSEIYYTQIQAYMGMSGYKKSVLLALNKDTSEFHHEWVDFDSLFYEIIKEKALLIVNAKDEPEKINRSPLFMTCRMCPYKIKCHFTK